MPAQLASPPQAPPLPARPAHAPQLKTPLRRGGHTPGCAPPADIKCEAYDAGGRLLGASAQLNDWNTATPAVADITIP